MCIPLQETRIYDERMKNERFINNERTSIVGITNKFNVICDVIFILP